MGPDRSQIFDVGVNFLSLRHQGEKPYLWVLNVACVGGRPTRGRCAVSVLRLGVRICGAGTLRGDH